MPFSNPVVGGTTLIRPAIKSPNFQTGVDGWSINRDGTAEFNSVIIRGNIVVVGSNGSIETELTSGWPTLYFYNANKSNYGYINIVSPNPNADAWLGLNSGTFTDAAFPGIDFRPRLYFAPSPVLQIVDDSNGTVYGGVVDTHTNYAILNVYNPSPTIAAELAMYNTGLIIIQGGNGSGLNGPMAAFDSTSLIFKNNIFGDGVAYRESTTYLEHTLNGSWTNMTLNSGWTAKAGYTVPQYRRNALGNVEFRGTMTGGTNVDNTQIATIPAALVPVNDTLMKPILAPTGAGSAGSSRLYNNGSTAIFCYGCAGAGDISLDGIFYSLAA